MFYRIDGANNSLISIKSTGITYKNCLKTPVQIDVQENEIIITAYISFSDNMLSDYCNKNSSKEKLMPRYKNNYSYADAFEEAIKSFWGKTYKLNDDTEIKVTVNTVRKGRSTDAYDEKQRFFNVKLTEFSNTSFVASSPWRWVWGFPLTLCPESIMLNWSPYHPGTIYLHKYNSIFTFKRVCAHEFGHILGIGDAYNAHYRFFYEAPDTKNYMMNHNESVNINEVMMVLKAHKTHKMQYFPYKFSFKTYFKALFTSISKNLNVFNKKKRKV